MWALVTAPAISAWMLAEGIPPQRTLGASTDSRRLIPRSTRLLITPLIIDGMPLLPGVPKARIDSSFNRARHRFADLPFRDLA